MKIGFLIESFPRISETWIASQLIDLKNRGHELYIYSIYPSSDSFVHPLIVRHGLLDFTQYFFNPNSSQLRFFPAFRFLASNIRNISLIKFYRVFRAFFSKSGSKPLFLFNYLGLRKMDDLDIFHAHFGEIGVILADMKQSKLLPKSKIVVSFHGHDIFPYNKSFYRKQYSVFAGFADALLVNSPYSKALLDDIIPFPGVHVIPVGLDTEYFSPTKDSDPRDFSLLFVGRLVTLKGPHIAIEIIRRLVKTNPFIRLDIVGDGEMRGELNQLIRAYNLEANVHLLGARNQDDIIRYMSCSDMFLYPAIYDKTVVAADTQGLVVQEAQAMELPVVCTDVGGISYGLLDGVSGYLVEEGDIDTFVNRVQYLMDHPLMKVEMGKAGREFVKNRFDSKKIGEQLIKIYETLVQ